MILYDLFVWTCCGWGTIWFMHFVRRTRFLSLNLTETQTVNNEVWIYKFVTRTLYYLPWSEIFSDQMLIVFYPNEFLWGMSKNVSVVKKLLTCLCVCVNFDICLTFSIQKVLYDRLRLKWTASYYLLQYKWLDLKRTRTIFCTQVLSIIDTPKKFTNFHSPGGSYIMVVMVQKTVLCIWEITVNFFDKETSSLKNYLFETLNNLVSDLNFALETYDNKSRARNLLFGTNLI